MCLSVKNLLKGHINEAFTEIFCINWFGIGTLRYLSSRSDLGFVFVETFVFENRLPDSMSLAESEVNV